jgi:3-oxoacyl-[acyl-carrier-protein] synthase-3
VSTPTRPDVPVVIDGISYRHGDWRDLETLAAGGQIAAAQIKALGQGGLRQYSVITGPVRRWYPECAAESLKKAGVQPADIDAVILFSSTFSAYDDHADIIDLCHDLGMHNAMPLGLFLGQCTNFSQALMVAGALIRSQGLRSLLLIGSDALDGNRAGRVLEGNLSVFSDTVMSCVVSRDVTAGFRLEYVDHATESSLSALDPQRDFLKIIDLFSRTMDGLCTRTYATTRRGPDDFSHLVLANLSAPVLKNYAAVARVPFARVPVGNVARFGHCFAYDQLITLATLAENGDITPGDEALILAVGGSYLFSSMIVCRL